ncbi:hypothetical protein ACHQM5_026050 [Ranunculus cassubicifolius]
MKRDLPAECDGCSLSERWLFHHVCVRATYRRLCTSCVLKLHSGSFCPICFEVYDGSNLPVNRVMCLRCPSVTHLDCVSKDVVNSYVCPPCSNPNFTFFDSSLKDGKEPIIDLKMAKVLVSAAQIAWISMSKAANGLRMEADRKVKEAAWKRKEAKESLERLSALVSKHKKGKEIMNSLEKDVSTVVVPEVKKNAKGHSAVVPYSEANVKSRKVGVPSNNYVSVGNRDKVEGSSTPPLMESHQHNSSAINDKSAGYLAKVKKNVVSQEEEGNGLFSARTKLQHPQNGYDTADQETGGQKRQPNQGLQLYLPSISTFSLA